MKYFNKVLVFSRLSYRLKTYRCHNLHAKNGINIFLNRVPVMFYSNMNDLDVKKRTEELTDSFMEARELMQDARESMNTVYFSEDMQEAAEAVSQTIQMYEKLLNELDENQKKDVVRTIGLKMAELKAQQAAMEEELKSD
eukprot:XP_011420767.1 PREDICTED: uncharacterized protein LOC105323366 [Crassostrea gigas]